MKMHLSILPLPHSQGKPLLTDLFYPSEKNNLCIQQAIHYLKIYYTKAGILHPLFCFLISLSNNRLF